MTREVRGLKVNKILPCYTCSLVKRGLQANSKTDPCSPLQSLKAGRIHIPLLGHPSLGLLKESQPLKKSGCHEFYNPCAARCPCATNF